jgi:23S rRNA (guanosine2251-2'-O)-methyltransferase
VNETWLEGAISVEAAIESGGREVQVIYVSKGKWSEANRRVLHLADSAGITVEHADRRTIDEIATGRTHGGVVAKVGPRRFQAMTDLLSDLASPFVVMLDGIEDPHNFGQAVRALYAAGAHGLILRPRNWFSAAAVVARASAGASERMPVAVVDDPGEAASYFREQGLLVACADKSGAESVYDVDLSGPLFLLIGGEKRGIMRSLRDEADIRVHVPYGREFKYSLGAVSSVGILAYEVMRQRHGSEER